MFRMMKSTVRRLVLSTVLRPPSVRYCSQTIYESLLGCCRMWEATGDTRWKARAERVLAILLKIQQPDGGFDIGYDFNFGRLHKRGDSTSPELVGLLALCEYGRLFDRDRVQEAAKRATEWIRRHAQELGGGEVAIPYSPYTINEVMVYNGTSFACGALGYYLGVFGADKEISDLYHGMVRYLDRVMSMEEGSPGRFWYYCDQSRDDWDEQRRVKIDYYHQMQQVEMHALAQQVRPDPVQLKLIRDAADHVAYLQSRHPIVPYTNHARYFKDQIHLWGLSSVIPGMLEAAVVLPERREDYEKVARAVFDWIATHAWNGNSFEAILQKDGKRIDPRFYMVRSDAWVFNACAAAAKHLGPGAWGEMSEACFATMERADFSGMESHASCWRRRAFAGMWRVVKQAAGR